MSRPNKIHPDQLKVLHTKIHQDTLKHIQTLWNTSIKTHWVLMGISKSGQVSLGLEGQHWVWTGFIWDVMDFIKEGQVSLRLDGFQNV